ncbi:MAG: hypothetical protein AVDCRST_MAG96-3916 [uncultured Segetibacter sp.]|uniref:DUF4190 domain-containing protein n=1 Tax=uncultured Segetibacter sp. TaxID=481133 RepID=A0A6J4TZY1_9BACT|nr:MAG: hypothetical protein AVDCRST_MAG96-3916 [uncultured Segetibacter sp.]
MRWKLLLFPAACIYLLLISATSVQINQKHVATEYEYKADLPLASNTIKAQKLNFFQRLMMKVFLKKYKTTDEVKADKLANTSLALAVAAFGVHVLGLLVPYLILATIPAGITAMITGGSALRNGTAKIGNAKTGKALGLGSLIAFAVLLIVVSIAVAAFWGAWN